MVNKVNQWIMVAILMVTICQIGELGKAYADQENESVTITWEGTVEIFDAADNSVPMEQGDELKIGYKVMTGENSRAEITWSADKSVLTMYDNTVMQIADLCFWETLKLFWGRIYSTPEDRRYRYYTPTAVAGIRGTKAIIDVAIDGTTTIQVIEGVVDATIRATGENIRLTAGQDLVVPPTNGILVWPVEYKWGPPYPGCQWNPYPRHLRRLDECSFGELGLSGCA